ncbi:MAG TPA: UDP-N-acetylmuramate--L-alanine ligase [Candidatus Marinimicrobia bacterium]|jgi:UDP-N-acetylmuramate--alanine ligase|nr:UDP-N-acetylmuramate--L-alanine ligase [Candidatus Neomarinimicrobiota bacterium]MDP7122025.1 UDP-N-acetylmuramate--L-alanine ligase [Candidatus Neomarinimicrobiota bacterium]MDP7217311.1 UDP-N-acetylmuramate--L-alanine ligase [Candidatus Neomarinimicrobiota bacterium]MDP7437537.1 UDP-N-acetylmuramate--L-alanine ligase [Candidatus Neomarinimicrobiota bacterium]HBN45887.1 UDP-N-acetylmuramate--L-alanine ligase [Candidatus Neomarinimicrobiota bacterium]|tara:strand:- start:6077 stop:7465 length:1389 start_codon:yes stop_codon:yes gene_type:complete
MFRKVKKIHFVGIGGIGMSGIAELLLNLGFDVSGSDINESPIVEKLIRLGADVHMGHSTVNLKDADVLVYSSAVHKENPEIQAALERNIPVIRRAEMLGELIAVKETSIGIGGTHGKTTTSSMIGTVLSEGKLDPTLVVGGLVKTIDSNAKLGQGDLIVVEADEFDRSFLALRPTISIITNIELEHTDCYKDLDDLKQAFIQFANSAPFYGAVIACADSPALMEIIHEIKRPVITYGLSKDADIRATNICFNETQTVYTLWEHEHENGTIKLNVPGEHNVVNSLAAIALGMEIGLKIDTIAKGLEAYHGVRRRFEIKGISNDIMVVDDYAHHPTEVTATLQAAREGWDRRIVSVFQPHLYTRTQVFYKEFAQAFSASDILIVTDVYPAREEPINGVSGAMVSNAARKAGLEHVHYIPNLDDIASHLDQIVQPGDMVITIGAGTIWRYCESYFEHLKTLEAAA